jgi:Fe-S cluster assembly ATP-binding protein
MLRIKDLRAAAGGRQILRGLNLEVGTGQVHAIITERARQARWPRCCRPHTYEVTGEVPTTAGNASACRPKSAARRPSASTRLRFPAVNLYFLRTAFNAIRKQRALMNSTPPIFALAKEREVIEMDESFMKRSVNEGFSVQRKRGTRFCRWRSAAHSTG